MKRARDEKCRKEGEIQKVRQQYQAEEKFKDEMIMQFCSLIIQEQWQHYRIMKTEKYEQNYTSFR